MGLKILGMMEMNFAPNYGGWILQNRINQWLITSANYHCIPRSFKVGACQDNSFCKPLLEGEIRKMIAKNTLQSIQHAVGYIQL